VLNALKKTSIEPYWFDTGTPTFLVRMIRANMIDPVDINGRICSKKDLMQVRMGSKDPIPLMFQTGYLTISTYDPIRERYTLRFPNREVEKAFAEELLPLYIKDVKDSSSEFSLFKFQDDLFDGMPDKFMERLAILFKSMPYEDQCEAVYRAVMSLLCKLCSLDVRAEQHSHKGRSDLEVLTPDNIYIFEFKYNGSVSGAMDQIEARDYAGKYLLDGRRIYLIGVNYENSGDKRGLEYEIKELIRP
ncbi:MAG: PD-(D/E)XK nuclease domain-containing protein, partial [Muribaculaceae bacterium]|nr:PD-(D/E)XK nuclease domain-containing protein [Muribaculaceae bacterium]